MTVKPEAAKSLDQLNVDISALSAEIENGGRSGDGTAGGSTALPPGGQSRAPLGVGRMAGPGVPIAPSAPGPAASCPAEAARRKRGCVSDLNCCDFNDSSADSHKREKGRSGVVATRRAARSAL